MKSLITLFIFLTQFCLADENLAKIDPLSGRAFFTAEELLPGELADLQIELQLHDGFFAYEERFQILPVNPSNLIAGELFIAPIVEFDDKISKKKKRGLHKKGTIKTQLQIPGDIDSSLKEISIGLRYIACTEKFCLTPRILPLNITVNIADKKPDGNINDIASSAFIQQQIDQNIWYALLLIFFFGLLTSLTPCVYPLIPITLAVLGANQQNSKIQSFVTSLTYVFGIGLTYAFLGVLAAQTGQLFGSFISHPLVTIAMSLIFFAMGLSLLGFFEIQAPAFIRNRMTKLESRRGLAGAFVSGLLAGVIASPCVGPVLVGVLAYIAKTQSSFIGFILLFTFAMGFGVLFIVLGTFSQFANKIPRSGAWMNIIKTALALCLFGLSVFYSWPLIQQNLPSSQSHQKQGVKWQKFSKDLVTQAKQDKKPIIIDFFADWCAACLELDEFTFSKPVIMEKSKSFVMLKVDATSPTDEIQALTQKYKVYGLPTILFIDSNGQVREDITLTGFEEAPDFLKRMNKLSP